MATRNLDIEQAGLFVRLIDNPNRQGTTTGKSKVIGSTLRVEVRFSPNEKKFVAVELLELVPEGGDIYDDIEAKRFGSNVDLRSTLTLEKLKGRLTNVLYSMEASNTDFYAHQFKPVLRCLESPVGRLLIADEVGLGKTIEAGFVWKELQARDSARRLLVVCPAMLREKWCDDLGRKFGINAQIFGVAELLEKLKS